MIVPKEKFMIHWNNSAKLVCPCLRADGAIWLYPEVITETTSPCKEKLCTWNWRGCHQYGSGSDWISPYMKERFWSPDAPLTEDEKKYPTKDDYVSREPREVME